MSNAWSALIERWLRLDPQAEDELEERLGALLDGEAGSGSLLHDCVKFALRLELRSPEPITDPWTGAPRPALLDLDRLAAIATEPDPEPGIRHELRRIRVEVRARLRAGDGEPLAAANPARFAPGADDDLELPGPIGEDGTEGILGALDLLEPAAYLLLAFNGTGRATRRGALVGLVERVAAVNVDDPTTWPEGLDARAELWEAGAATGMYGPERVELERALRAAAAVARGRPVLGFDASDPALLPERLRGWPRVLHPLGAGAPRASTLTALWLLRTVLGTFGGYAASVGGVYAPRGLRTDLYALLAAWGYPRELAPRESERRDDMNTMDRALAGLVTLEER